MMPTKLKNWMVEELRKSFATTGNIELGELFGVHPTTVGLWGKKLGLKKDSAYLLKTVRTAQTMSQCVPHNLPHSSFKPGHKPYINRVRSVKCIRLDTLEIMPSVTEAAKVIGVSNSALRRAIGVGRPCRGIRVMHLDAYRRLIDRLKNKSKWELTAVDRELLNRELCKTQKPRPKPWMI